MEPSVVQSKMAVAHHTDDHANHYLPGETGTKNDHAARLQNQSTHRIDNPTQCYSLFVFVSAGTHLRVGEGPQSSSQVHRHRRRSSQRQKRILLLPCWLAHAAQASGRHKCRQACWHERSRKRSRCRLAAKVQINFFFNRQLNRRLITILMSHLSFVYFNVQRILHRFSARLYIILVAIFCFLIPTWLPCYLWGESVMLAWYATIFRHTLTLNCTWLVNSAAHMYGTKPYDA